MPGSSISITAIILTYGGRTYIYEVLKHLSKKKSIKDIVVVSNGQVFIPPSELSIPCCVINKESNEGSAAGYATGIEKAKELNNKFAWLLDDDNLPNDDALEVLLDIWEKKEFSKYENPVALQCYRTSQFAYKNIFNKKKLQLLPPANSFMYFHLRKLPRIILNKFLPRRYMAIYHQRLYESDAAFYGGLFVETKTLNMIPLPDSKYFMYVDDLAFTASINKYGGKIFVSVDSIINDLDFSIQLDKKNKLLYHPVLDISTNMKAYFFCRNVAYYSKTELTTNRFIYQLNKLIFLGILKAFSILRRRGYRFKVMLAGIRIGDSMV